MTDDDKALVERLREGVLYGDARLHNPKGHDPLRMEAADRIEALSAENQRLRERVERLGRDKETLLEFARAIQTWRSDADSYDEECDHPQRDYCEDVELMEKAAGYALRRVAERAALGDTE